jgi:predicted permease
MRWTNGIRARLRLLSRRDAEVRMAEEIGFHLEMQAEEYVRRGMSPEDARRRALLDFGGVEGHKEALRDGRTFAWLDGLSLDFKLGVRMLRKYPGLSLVSVIGMTVAIAIGAAGFGFIHALVDPRLPLDEGERVVSIQNADARNPGSPHRQSLHDFLVWREEAGSLRDLSAYANHDRNLTIPGEGTAPVRIAQMTAAGFRVARVAPVLGRPLLDDDERPGAPPVVVIAHEEWRRRFRGDPGVIGRQVRLDGTPHTVIGVMPEGFRFPVNHRYWVPLRLDPAAHEPGGGPAILMFGRLADGATMDQARAELATIGRRMAGAHPETHRHLRPRVLPYTYDFTGIDSPATAWLLRAAQLALSLLLVVVSVNVAMLVYARTATRTGEIVVRTALGASKRRVVTQLFTEALVLSLAAAVAGLAAAHIGLAWVPRFLHRGNPDQLPFWLDLGLSPALVAYVACLAVLAAAIVGVVPALKATGRNVQGGLQQLASRGSRMQLGRTWTALVVIQVAIAVAVLPYALFVAGQSVWRGAAEPAYPVEEVLRAALSMEREGAPARPGAAGRDDAAVRFHGGASELLRRLEAEPSVAGSRSPAAFPARRCTARSRLTARRPGAGSGATRWMRGSSPSSAFPCWPAAGSWRRTRPGAPTRSSWTGSSRTRFSGAATSLGAASATLRKARRRRVPGSRSWAWCPSSPFRPLSKTRAPSSTGRWLSPARRVPYSSPCG